MSTTVEQDRQAFDDIYNRLANWRQQDKAFYELRVFVERVLAEKEAAQRAEPVAYKLYDLGGQIVPADHVFVKESKARGLKIEPLYAHPPAIPAEYQQVIDTRTHWAAPLELTKKMRAAFCICAESMVDAVEEDEALRQLRKLYAVMRDAYLRTQQKEPGDGN